MERDIASTHPQSDLFGAAHRSISAVSTADYDRTSQNDYRHLRKEPIPEDLRVVEAKAGAGIAAGRQVPALGTRQSAFGPTNHPSEAIGSSLLPPAP